MYSEAVLTKLSPPQTIEVQMCTGHKCDAIVDKENNPERDQLAFGENVMTGKQTASWLVQAGLNPVTRSPHPWRGGPRVPSL